MADGKTVKIKCATWDQVETFYTEKLRGNVLVVKMPFRPGIGDAMTVALGLPDGLVFAIDGTVVKIGGDDAGKVPVAVKLFGMTLEVRAQLKRMVANGRGYGTSPVAPVPSGVTPPPPSSPPRAAAGTKPPRPRIPETVPPMATPRVEDVAEEERSAFSALEQTKKRFLVLEAHAVLDVPPGADAETLRAGFIARAQRLHPDLYRRYRSPALRSLAAETFLLVCRAYERARAAPIDGFLMAADPAADTAPSTLPPSEPMPVTVEPLRATQSSPYSELTITESGESGGDGYDDELTFTTSTRGKALTAEELFDENEAAARSAAAAAVAPRAAEASPMPEIPDTPTPTSEIAVPDAGPPPSVEEGRAAFDEGRFREACEAFAAILRAEPRNRAVRALYHVASGMELKQKGEGVKARLMFETALAHDRNCEEAHRALSVEPDRKSGLFKRFFDR